MALNPIVTVTFFPPREQFPRLHSMRMLYGCEKPYIGIEQCDKGTVYLGKW